MRQVTDIKRNKRTFNLSFAELKKGDWLKEIPNSDMVELSYKKNYLTINDCKISKLEDPKNKSEKDTMEDIEND